jgi:hypothetical protein
LIHTCCIFGLATAKKNPNMTAAKKKTNMTTADKLQLQSLPQPRTSNMANTRTNKTQQDNSNDARFESPVKSKGIAKKVPKSAKKSKLKKVTKQDIRPLVPSSPLAGVEVKLTFDDTPDGSGRRWPKHLLLPSRNPQILGELAKISCRISEGKVQAPKPGQLEGLVVAGAPEQIGGRTFYPSSIDGKVSNISRNVS